MSQRLTTIAVVKLTEDGCKCFYALTLQTQITATSSVK